MSKIIKTGHLISAISRLKKLIAELATTTEEAIEEVSDSVSEKAPTSHASTATTYGAGTASNYGHVKLSDTYTSSVGAASASLAASQSAVYNAYNTLLKKWGTTITTASEDLDNYKTAGIYYFSTSYTPTNIPAGVNGWLLVLTYGSSAIKQVWFRHGTATTNDFQTYVRVYGSGAWGDWARFAMIESDGYLNATDISASGGIAAASVEIYASSPYIDFHRNSSSSDYTSRIIESGTNGYLYFYKSAGSTGCTCYAASWSTISSRKMKDDIKTITDDEAKAILDLEPTTFVFKGETERNAGLIAEDTYKVLPQVVKVPE